MQLTATLKPRQVARREIVKQMERGVSVREARMNSAVPMHRTTFYRLLKRAERRRTSVDRWTAWSPDQVAWRSPCPGLE